MTPSALVREEVDIRTVDGELLRATVVSPGQRSPRVVVVLAHAMFARRSEFEKPTPEEGWLTTLALHGARAIAFDFRGHGDSGKSASSGGFWSYDDLVTRDLPAVVAAATARSEGAKVIVVGHSLGGHAALAACGAGHMRVDGLVLIAANVWMPHHERSLARRVAKRAVMESLRLSTARVGYFPARTLRQGSDDEAAPFIHDLVRFYESDRWTSGDGRVDFEASMATIAAPLLAVASRGDRIECHPESARAFLSNFGGKSEMFIVSEGDGGNAAPSHMGLVTSPSARQVRDTVVRWILER